ncbi:MAG: hypothetical protein HY554_06990 [Elusimicrobia bacterium]|nr:hypothetical protein [Elusimicrobiota bacterium]
MRAAFLSLAVWAAASPSAAGTTPALAALLREAGLPELPAPPQIEAVTERAAPRRFTLASIEDNYWNTGYVFVVNGLPVRLAGGRTADKLVQGPDGKPKLEKGKVFLALVPKGEGPRFIDGGAIVLGHREETINGVAIRISLDKSLLHPYGGSRIHVEQVTRVTAGQGVKETLVTLLKPSIPEFVERGYLAGAPVTLGGDEYRLFYGHAVHEAGGRFAMSESRFVALLHKGEDRPVPFPVPSFEVLLRSPVLVKVRRGFARISIEGGQIVVEDAR